MKYKHYAQSIALFLIFLVVNLPIAFAETDLTVISYAGQDNVQGFIRSFDDYLAITASIKPNLTVNSSFTQFSPANIFVEIFGAKDGFDSCEENSGEFSCVYSTTKADRSSAAKNFVVAVYDDKGIEIATEENTFYIDGENPEIVTFTTPAYFTSSVNISISAKDTACAACVDACSGIEVINLTFEDETKQTIKVGNTSDKESICEYSTILETDVDEFGIEDGIHSFCLVAVDRVQNTDEKCKTVTVDTTAPSISSGSFAIKDKKGNVIEHISSNAIDATVSVNITEEVSGLGTVVADLSALNYLSPEDYKDISGTCTETSAGKYTCTWGIFIALVDDEGKFHLNSTSKITINASDKAGNKGTVSKTVGFVEDETAPVVLDIISAFDGFLNAKNNTLAIEILEDASGFDDVNVYLDLNDAGLGQKQADYCEDAGGIWYCYLKSLAMPTSLKHGKQITVRLGAIEDDAKNAYDKAISIDKKSFIYDEKGPEFLNVTIGSLGREADVITEGDVVYILAYLEDDVSGINEHNVYADFGDFDSSNDIEPAQYCAKITADTWECYWEYIGSLDAGDSIALNMIAYDNAGNKKDSDDDNILAKIRVVGTLAGTAEYWADKVAVDTVPALNPNFLYFTSKGTIVRFDTGLVSTSGSVPYVHSFQYQNCVAATDLTNQVTAQEWYDAAIIGQYYYDESDRTEKYILVQIPAFFYGQANASVEEGSFIDVVCTAAISEAATEYSDIYANTETVNLTASIPLYAGLYTEPSLVSIDKIQRAEKFLNTVDKINKILGFWSEWGQKICGPINGVRVVANNMVTMLKSINTLAMGEATGAVASMVEVTNFLNSFWYGARNEADYEGKVGKIGKEKVPGTDTVEKTYPHATKAFKNKYKFPSLGYVCDTVLCESCTESWNKMFQSWKKKGTSEDDLPQGMYIAGEYVPNLVDSKYLRSWPFNPRENLVVALVCNPPCVSGIYAQLNVYKEILVAYNVCLNIATMKGEDIVQCDEFLAAQICQNVVNAFFWSWFWSGLQTAFSRFAVDLVFDKAITELAACTGTFTDFTDPNPSCSAYRSIVTLTTLATTAVDTYNTVQSLFNFEDGLFGNKTNEENVEELQQQTEEDIGDQLGTSPSY